MKRTFINLFIIFTICFIVAGCNNNDSNNNVEKKINNNTSISLKTVTKENFQKIVKDNFGIIIDNQTGWTLEEVSNANGENSLRIKYAVDNGPNGKDIIKTYVEQSLELNDQIIYSYGLNEEMTSMVKKEKYSSFDNYATDNLNEVYGLYQAIWIYDYDNEEILCSINIDDKEAIITFNIIS